MTVCRLWGTHLAVPPTHCCPYPILKLPERKARVGAAVSNRAYGPSCLPEPCCGIMSVWGAAIISTQLEPGRWGTHGDAVTLNTHLFDYQCPGLSFPIPLVPRGPHRGFLSQSWIGTLHSMGPWLFQRQFLDLHLPCVERKEVGKGCWKNRGCLACTPV